MIDHDITRSQCPSTHGLTRHIQRDVDSGANIDATVVVTKCSVNDVAWPFGSAVGILPRIRGTQFSGIVAFLIM
jgi:hypothetical protein